jgi:hypothetical protein
MGMKREEYQIQSLTPALSAASSALRAPSPKRRREIAKRSMEREE